VLAVMAEAAAAVKDNSGDIPAAPSKTTPATSRQHPAQTGWPMPAVLPAVVVDGVPRLGSPADRQSGKTAFQNSSPHRI